MSKNLRASIKGALNSSIKPGLLSPAQFRGSTLDLDFAGAKSLKNQVGKEDVVSFTRASSGTYVDGDGLIKSATNNTPRFDHDPSTGESLGLLIEEARTNLLTYSENFTQWGISRVTRESGQAAPDGTSDAYKVTSTTSGQSARIFQTLNSSAGTVVTLSVYLRVDSGSLSQQASIALGSKAVYASKNITLTTEWQRFEVTGTVPADLNQRANPLIYLNPDNDSGAAVTGDYFYAWGAQVEAGSFPTSYIPTENSTVTRAADVASIDGSNFSGWYNQSEGTMFADSQTPYPVASGKFPTPLKIADGSTSNNDFAVGFLTETLSSSNIENNNVNATPGYMSPLSGVRRRKIAAAAADNDAFAVTNGTLTSVKVNDVLLPRNHSIAFIGGELSYNSQNGTIRRITYWPARLPNETLQTITQ